MPLLTIATLLTVTSCLVARPEPVGFRQPESALYDPLAEAYRVPHRAKGLLEADRDGFVLHVLNAFPDTRADSILRTSLPQERLPLPAGMDFVNGIARASGGALFVGTMRSGRIVRLAPDGSATTFANGADGVFAGAALRYDAARGLLWGTSTDIFPERGPEGELVRRRARVFARDVQSGRLVHVVEVPEGSFANDLALAPDGSVYVTDSFGPRVLRFDPETSRVERYAESPMLDPEGSLGPSGLALGPDGALVVGLYGPGRLVRIRRPAAAGEGPRADRITLPRLLENPDGIAWLPARTDSAAVLLVLEGAAESGDGRLLRITLDGPLSAGHSLAGRIDTLASGMTGPVNLTTRADGVAPDTVWVTESGVQFRLEGGFEVGRSAVHQFILP